MSEEIVDALQDVESAVGRVETAVGKQTSCAACVLWAAFGFFCGHSREKSGTRNGDMPWLTTSTLAKC